MKLIGKTNIDFIGKRYISISFSILLILITIVSLIIHKGPNLGIDFTGGILVQIKFKQLPKLLELRNILSEGGINNPELKTFPGINSVIIQIKTKQEESEQITTKIKDIFLKKNIEFNVERVEFVGPKIGKYLSNRAILSILLSFLGIIIYVALRFKSSIWGVSGVIALIHDVFITMGLLSILNREITLNVIAALLTLAGYSINDTIVIFDRIRENLTLQRKEPLDKILNISINQTLSRTIITSLTVELVLLVLFLLGGEVIHDFALSLLFGCFIGTYSSIFIASPIVYEWILFRTKRK